MPPKGYFAVRMIIPGGSVAPAGQRNVLNSYPRDPGANASPYALRVDEVEAGRTYVMLVSTNSGLWRYVVGDLVQITSVQPLRIKIASRTSQYINAFGEESLDP